MFGNNCSGVYFVGNIRVDYGTDCYDADAVCIEKLILLPACLDEGKQCESVIHAEQFDSAWLEASAIIAAEDFNNTEAKEQFLAALVSYVAILHRSRRGDMATDLAAEIANAFVEEGKRAAFIANTLFRADGLAERFGIGSLALELPKLPAAREFVKLSSIGKYYFE